MRHYSLHCVVLAASLLGIVPAIAAPIEQVEVTATRSPTPVGQGAFSAVSLDSTQLSSSDRLDAALEQVPGVSLFRRTSSISANPTTQGISLRSIAPSGAGRALVLLNGVPMNDPFGGWVIWTGLLAEDIARATVVRGAGTGPYGAGALTGTIALTERDGSEGLAVADLSAGGLGTIRGAAAGGAKIGPVSLFGSVSAEHSHGWIPVLPPQRGAADRPLWFNGGSASLRAQAPLGHDLSLAARIGYYVEARGNGLEGGKAGAHGTIGSLTVARAATAAHFGWRLQAWTVKSDLTNLFVSVAPDRSSASPVNHQYATPALGWGVNAAALGTTGRLRWEVGTDLRDDSGEARENYFNLGGIFQNNRRSGGQLIVGGLYGDVAYDTGRWLVTAGLRGDKWATSQGHLVQTKIATGALIAADYPKSRSGLVPTGRIGARRNFADGEYIRAAVYSGFRPPSLNELYRPFRVGNDVTNANAGLKPEKLYGGEVGWGGDARGIAWDTTLFWNRLHEAITNVTIGTSYAGGALRQRQNAGDIDAIGFEGDLSKSVADNLVLHAAIALTDARVHAGGQATQLDGKRPAQAPLAAITAGAVWQVTDPVSLAAELRWETSRFDDDLNSRRLGSAFSLNLRADWHISEDWTVWLAVTNATNSKVATAIAANGITSYDAPRTASVGVTFRP
jgi:outer membrane receptor protein involved in Fe transport